MTTEVLATEQSRTPERRYLKATLAGAGGMLALLWFLLEQRPELAQLLLERIVIAWGPQFVILLLLFGFLYLLADRYAPRLIAAQRETAVALQSLARAVEQLVARENSFQREQDVLLNHVARRVEAIHKLLNGRLHRLARASSEPPPKKARPRSARPNPGQRSSKPELAVANHVLSST
ncbi:MAG TPA: hypothetical protein VNN18_06945 [Candidatus Xenobia bacterium]|nr:hypothetical protein [Candidatus Xenobia bacterium]